MVYWGRASTVDDMKYTKVQYHPNGYPQLGLVPRSIHIKYREGMTAATLKTRLERWERAHGNPKFQARRLTKLPAPLAYELVQVYISMRERFPEVKPDYINFYADLYKGTLGESLTYVDNLPVIQSLLSTGVIDDTGLYGIDDLVEIVKDFGGSSGDLKALRNERAFIDQESVLNPLAAGVMSIGAIYSHKRAYQKLLNFWVSINERSAAQGLTARAPEMGVSPAAFTLIHEFGHLVESKILVTKQANVEKVYKSLSEVVLGIKNAKPNQWRYHLINYPAYTYANGQGKHVGGQNRQRETRRVLRGAIRAKLGTYATVSRDEIFAEAFSHAYAGRSVNCRASYKPFINTLKSIGVAATRLPAYV